MALFKAIKRQALKVIEWEDNTKETMVYRYPLTDRDEIMNSSTLVVRPSQVALFVHKGIVCDVFAPGTYKLATENIPIITKVLALPTLGDSPIKAEVYYVNTKQMTGQKWGTSNPIMMRDNDFGTVRIRGFGVYSFKVDNPKKFMEEMFGTNAVYTVNDVVEQIKPMVVNAFADTVAESKISALDLAANYKEFGQKIIEQSQEDFGNFGLKICNLTIENISLPKEVEEVLDKRTSMGIMKSEMGTYAQYEAIGAMRDAANNPSGNNFAGMGVGLATGVSVGNVYANALNGAINPQAQQPAQPAPAAQPVVAAAPVAAAPAATKECPECHAQIKATMKFCPECGAKQPQEKFCPECGAKVGADAKFCPECGHKL